MSPARRRLLLVLGALVLVVAVVVSVSALRGGGSTTLRAADPSPGPVVLVPGYGGSTSSLSVLADDLRRNGRTAVVVSLPGDGTGDLRATATALGKVVDAQLAGGAKSVDLVGYSAGGVTVRLWAASADAGRDGQAKARRIVTLGSPHHGTQVAALATSVVGSACPTACQQLVPGSDVLSGLAETPGGAAWTSLWTTQDQTVTPPTSASLQGAVDLPVQQLCPTAQVAHGDLPRSPVVDALVLSVLQTGTLPAACPSS